MCVRSNILSILLLSIMIASIMLPATNAFQGEPSIGISSSATPAAKKMAIAPYKGSDLNPDKLDSAILDSYYVSELAKKYGKLYRSTISTSIGEDIGFDAVGLIVKVDDLASTRVLERVVSEYNAVIAKKWPEINSVLIAVPADPAVVGKVSKELAKLPEVRMVYLDRIAQPAMWDTTVMLGTDYLNNLGINGTNVTVAVLDTGVDPSHPAIPTPAYWKDFINGSTTPYDDHGHGTHVTGTILGNGPSIFNTTTGMWHSVLVGETGQFNFQDLANLTYYVNVTGYGGSNVTLDLRHLYILWDTTLYYYYNVIFAAGAYIYVKFDNGSWMLIANYTGMNQTTPVVDKYNITVPANASSMYVSFIYDYLATYSANGTLLLSHWDIDGWFIDYVKVYNATNTSDILLFDDVNSIYGPLPPYIVNATWWIRTPSNFHGVAPGATLASGKICEPTGCPYSAILNGMEWALNISADVVSMSIGGTAFYYDPIAQMADYLVANGVTVVIAAGNSGPEYYTIESPGISHYAITVGAATKAWTTAYFSSAGPSPVDYHVKPDVSAPGMAVSSSVPLALGIWAPDFPYEAWAGTSMATPHVSGLAALLKSVHPSWSPLMIKSAIVSTADWLMPSVYFPYGEDVYRQGAGMIDPVQAVSTTVLPLPANVFLGTPLKELDNSTSRNITILNVGSTPVNVTVIDVDLYWTSANLSNLQYENWAQQIASPLVNQSFNIPAGGAQTITLTVDLTNLSMPAGTYGGYVEFSTNTSGVIKVIFGFQLYQPVWLNGTVKDFDTRQRVGGANVSVWDPYLNRSYGWSITGPDGKFAFKVPGNSTVRIMVDANYTLYYSYISYPIPTDDGVVYKVFLKEREPSGSILVIPDLNAASNVTASINAFKSAAQDLGFNVFVWKPDKLGTIYGAALSGDFAGLIYFAGGYYYPISDDVDYTAFILYSRYMPGLIVLSGGDIGWFHDSDMLMKYVAHANFTYDMWPGYYNVTLLKNRLTSTLLGPYAYLMFENAPTGVPMGNITIYGIPGYWPDAVTPVNNGTYAAVWGDNTSVASIVAYYGNGTEPAKSVYFAFDFEELPPSIQYEFAKRVLAFAFDYMLPSVATDNIHVSLDNGIITVNASNAFQDDTEIAFYLLKIYDPTGTNVIYSDGSYSGVFNVNASAIGLMPGTTYNIEVLGVDLVGNEVSAGNISIKYYPSAVGGGALFLGNTTVSVTGIGLGATISSNVTNATLIQVLSFPDNTTYTSILGVPLPVNLYRYNIYMDIHANESTPGALAQVNISIKINTNLLRIRTTQVYWWNGVTWAPVSNYTIDPSTGTVTIIINKHTSPSTADLGGTPVILSIVPKLIGGTLAVEGETLSPPIIAMAIVLIAALSGVLMIRRKP